MSLQPTTSKMMDIPKQQRLSNAVRSRRHHMLELPAVIHAYRKALDLRVEMRSLGVLDDDEDDADDYMLTQAGIGILPVCGVLSNDSWCADRSYRSMTALARAYQDDSNCRGVLMIVDSPGGDTDGAFEARIAIDKLAAAKPLYCLVDTCAYSAGYLQASGSEQIYVPAVTGGVGSVGVYCAHVDYSRMLEQEGIDVTLISAGKGKVDGNPYEPLSKEVRAAWQAEIDQLYDEFVGAVSRGRKISSDAIKEMGADLKPGSAAIGARLADRVGDLRMAYTDLVSKISTNSKVPFAQSAQGGKLASAKEGEATTMSQPNKEAVDIQATAHSSGMAEGVGYSMEVMDLCAQAGQPAAAREFIEKRMSIADIGKSLIATKAAKDAQTQVRSGALAQDKEAEFSFANYTKAQHAKGGK